MQNDNLNQLPVFLCSFENLTEHFASHFDALSSNERGDQFLELACKIIPFIPEGQKFPAPEPSEKKSHDKGIDLLTAVNSAGGKLFGQSKFKITTKDEFDTIVSKFKDFESGQLAEQLLFPNDEEPERRPVYVIVTSSKLDNIITLFEKSELASKEFYSRLLNEKRLHRIDGPRILGILQTLYRKAYVLAATIEIESVENWIRVDNVYIGVPRGKDIAQLYTDHGDAIFFENIRDFLGVTSGKKETEGRETVNAKIIETLTKAAPRMLERNNGITFRAERVTLVSKNRITLEGAAVVNGCQTTMCLWHSRDDINDSCYVTVKVVVTDDAWEVAG